MKKIISLLLIILLILSMLVACGKDENYYLAYNKEHLKEHRTVTSLTGVQFEIPNEYFTETKSSAEFQNLIFKNTDNSKYISEILGDFTLEEIDNDEFILSDFNNFFYIAGHLNTENDNFQLQNENVSSLLKTKFDFLSVTAIENEDIITVKHDKKVKTIIPVKHENSDYNINFKGYLSIISSDKVISYFMNTYPVDKIDQELSLQIAKSFTSNNQKLTYEKDNSIYNININNFINGTIFKENNSKINDFTLNINNVDIKLPLSYKDFEEKTNFNLSSTNLEKKIPSNSTISLKVQHREKTLSIILANTSKDEILLKDSIVVGIKSDSMELYNNSYIFTRIVLPQNIIVGKSSIGDINKAFGEPSETNDTDVSEYKTLTYKLGKFESDIYTKLELTIDKNTQLLHSFEYTNLILN